MKKTSSELLTGSLFSKYMEQLASSGLVIDTCNLTEKNCLRFVVGIKKPVSFLFQDYDI